MATTSTTSESLVVFQAYNTSIEAEIAKSILDSAGIFCTLQGEYLSTIYAIGAFPTQLLVRAEDVEEARRLLDVR
ncbi:MAG: DUF2007 domain-containing protein [Alistipes sp.]|jgi:hypothetical protein|nr:DUF2007 domain-containing protein [Alistipes sp.]